MARFFRDLLIGDKFIVVTPKGQPEKLADADGRILMKIGTNPREGNSISPFDATRYDISNDTPVAKLI